MKATTVLLRASEGVTLCLGLALAPVPSLAASKQAIGATKCTYQVGYQLCLGDCSVTKTNANGTKTYRCKQYQCDVNGNCTTNGTEQEYTEFRNKLQNRLLDTTPGTRFLLAPN